MYYDVRSDVAVAHEALEASAKGLHQPILALTAFHPI